jgi:hypothetical protein
MARASSKPLRCVFRESSWKVGRLTSLKIQLLTTSTSTQHQSLKAHITQTTPPHQLHPTSTSTQPYKTHHGLRTLSPSLRRRLRLLRSILRTAATS